MAAMEKLPPNHFDVLRLVAALMVVYTHYLRLFALGADPLKAATGYSSFSTLGIAVFFIISGYLVTGSLAVAGSRREFMRNRLLRIYPALIGCLLVTVFIIGAACTTLPLGEYFTSSQTYLYFLNLYLYGLQYVLPGVFADNPRQYNVNGSLWTLCIEMSCYLLLALVFLRSQSRLRKTFIALFGVVLAGNLYTTVHYLLFTYSATLDSYKFFLLYFNFSQAMRFLLFFLIGGLLRFAEVRYLRHPVVFVLCCSLWVLSWSSEWYQWAEFFCMPYMVLYCGLIPASKLSRNLRRMGDISYGVYLYHAPVGQASWALLHNRVESPLAMSIIALAVRLAVGMLSWHMVEKRALRLKTYSVRQ